MKLVVVLVVMLDVCLMTDDEVWSKEDAGRSDGRAEIYGAGLEGRLPSELFCGAMTLPDFASGNGREGKAWKVRGHKHRVPSGVMIVPADNVSLEPAGVVVSSAGTRKLLERSTFDDRQLRQCVLAVTLRKDTARRRSEPSATIMPYELG